MKPLQKYQAILKQDVITKKDLTYLLKYANGRYADSEALIQELYYYNDEQEIEFEHAMQGLSYLKKLFVKQNGALRNTKQIKHIEEGNRHSIVTILNNFKEFRLVGFSDIMSSHGRYMGFNYFRPIWRCIAQDGSYFEYTQQASPVEINTIQLKGKAA